MHSKTFHKSDLIKKGSLIHLKDHVLRYKMNGLRVKNYKYCYNYKLPTHIEEKDGEFIEKIDPNISYFNAEGTTVLVHNISDYYIDFTTMVKKFDEKLNDVKMSIMRKLLIRDRDTEEYTVIEFNKPDTTKFAIASTFSDDNPDEFLARIIGQDIKVLNFSSFEDYEKNYLIQSCRLDLIQLKQRYKGE